jgi:osmotically-inducible protein OsmY
LKSLKNPLSFATLGAAGVTLVIVAVMSGCAGVLVGSAATSAVVANDERTTGTFIEDQTIELKALDAIRSREHLKSQTHLSVTSYNQTVLVTGQAPTEELRKEAISLISQVEKVNRIFDEIEIGVPTTLATRSSDSLLTAKVKTKLFTLDGFDATKVKVVTENAVVYLMGILSSSEADTAATAASFVGGVRKVVKLFEYKS